MPRVAIVAILVTQPRMFNVACVSVACVAGTIFHHFQDFTSGDIQGDGGRDKRDDSMRMVAQAITILANQDPSSETEGSPGFPGFSKNLSSLKGLLRIGIKDAPLTPSTERFAPETSSNSNVQ